MTLTGLSLSFCIQDILEGRVAEEQVLRIVCGFSGWTGEPHPNYWKTYWRDYDRQEIEALLGRLEIVPAISDHRNIAFGHWMEGEATPERLANPHDRIHVAR